MKKSKASFIGQLKLLRERSATREQKGPFPQ